MKKKGDLAMGIKSLKNVHSPPFCHLLLRTYPKGIIESLGKYFLPKDVLSTICDSENLGMTQSPSNRSGVYTTIHPIQGL